MKVDDIFGRIVEIVLLCRSSHNHDACHCDKEVFFFVNKLKVRACLNSVVDELNIQPFFEVLSDGERIKVPACVVDSWSEKDPL